MVLLRRSFTSKWENLLRLSDEGLIILSEYIAIILLVPAY